MSILERLICCTTVAASLRFRWSAHRFERDSYHGDALPTELKGQCTVGRPFERRVKSIAHLGWWCCRSRFGGPARGQAWGRGRRPGSVDRAAPWPRTRWSSPCDTWSTLSAAPASQHASMCGMTLGIAVKLLRIIRHFDTPIPSTLPALPLRRMLWLRITASGRCQHYQEERNVPRAYPIVPSNSGEYW